MAVSFDIVLVADLSNKLFAFNQATVVCLSNLLGETSLRKTCSYLGLCSQLSVFVDKFDVCAASFCKLVFEILSFRFVASSILLLLGNVLVKVPQTRLQLLVGTYPTSSSQFVN